MKRLIFIFLSILPLFVFSKSGFTSQPIPDSVWTRMQGKSYHPNPYIHRSDLRYLRVLHYDYDGKIHQGEIVCNKNIASDLLDIFGKLYDAKYPIGKIRLIDDYGANDEKSMQDNNTSCFNYRKVAGSKKLSAHSRGMAVDINTFYNPYYKKYRSGKIKLQPSTAGAYVNRSRTFRYKITKGDLCYRLFIQHGFKWGGLWRSVKDYQHFEK